MQTASGIITLVQEERFQLARDDGAKQLFTLSRHAGFDIAELQHLERSRRHVVLHYQPAAELIAGEVHEILAD